MKKYCNILLGTLCTGVLLSGCAFNEKPAVPVKNEADIQKEMQAEKEKKELAMAKFLFKNKNLVQNKAFETFQEYALQGNADAEAWLGRCYMNGIGTPVNYDKAFEYFSKAAAKNHPYGINGLGVCKQFGYGTAMDLRAAIGYYKKAADMKFPLATLNLARTYYDRDGGFFDEKLAEEYFKKAVQLNADGAKAGYADFLLEARRYNEVFNLLKDAADFGETMLLAQCYENGWGVNVDIKKSIALMEKSFKMPGSRLWRTDRFYIAALEELIINGKTDFYRHCLKTGAELDDKECLYSYALMLEEEKQDKEAVKYMMRAADKGYDLAQLLAGRMLNRQKDFTRAIKYFTMATLSSRTQNDAVEALSVIYHDLNDQKQKNHWSIYGHSLGITYCRNNVAIMKLLEENLNDEDFAQATALLALSYVENNKFAQNVFNDITLKNDYNRLRFLADRGNGNALFTLGVIGCWNKEAHPNDAIGLELLEKAVKQKNPFACNVLGDIYRTGFKVPKDIKKALEYYRKGAEYKHGQSAKMAALVMFYEDELKDTPVEEVKKAFEQSLALNEFFVLYEYGQFMEFKVKDLKKAEELYRRAAQLGDTKAMLRLYHLIRKKNLNAAMDHLWNAVELDNYDAELTMGDIQQIWSQPRTAYSMYLRSNLRGEPSESFARLAECYLQGYGCEVNINMFWKAADMAYENGSSTICLILGNVYHDGKICPKDMKKAKEYYAEGAKRGNKICRDIMEKLK